MSRPRPKSLNGAWDVLYRDYPEVYHAFESVPKKPDHMLAIMDRFPLTGKVVVDVGSGSGLSALKLARQARQVIGVEIEGAMIQVAEANASEREIGNVHLVQGDAERIPLADDSVDAAMGIYLAGGDIRIVAAEMERVVRPDGVVLRADVASGWYGGHLNPIITGQTRDEMPAPSHRDAILPTLGYEAFDIDIDQDYGSADRAASTFGFIHHERAVDHILAHNLTVIRWKVRVWHKTV